MRLLIFILVTTILYAIAIVFLIHEFKTQTSYAQRKNNQSIPIMVSSTLFYIVLVAKTTILALQGVLPLL